MATGTDPDEAGVAHDSPPEFLTLCRVLPQPSGVKIGEFIAIFVVMVVAVWFALETFPAFQAYRLRVGGLRPALPGGPDGPIIDI